MKNSRRSGTSTSRSNSRKTTLDLLRLIHRHLMSSTQDGSHATFSRVNLEGSNVGSAMAIRPSDGGFIVNNVYVSNNIQGVNNSILVGSSVQMGDPGVHFSLSDPNSDSGKNQEKDDSIWLGWRFVVGFLLCFGIVIVLLFL